jgi:sucrose phosphorylase
MVYNFSLPPLVLHAFQTGSAETLSGWAAGLELPSDEVTFFNFLASHDGIGVNPLRGILPEEAIEAVVERIRKHGGLVSMKNEADGTQRPYELNINYFDALSDPKADETPDTQIDRFITAHAILLAVRGVPAIYFHSLFGSRSWLEGAVASGHNRTINRRKFQRSELEALLSDPYTRQARVFQRLKQLLKIRQERMAFHPHGTQEVVSCPPEVFGLLRISPDGKERVLCLHNTSNRRVQWDEANSSGPWTHELLEDRVIDANSPITLLPYQTQWLVKE